jgi:sensor histidine kinase regulating citrate/malate metabolism
MTEPEETYGDGRARALQALLRSLAARIVALDERGELLAHAGELMKLIGDIRSELFHYEVRATYDTPEIAESRRIVSESQANEPHWEPTTWQPDEKRERDSDREW